MSGSARRAAWTAIAALLVVPVVVTLTSPLSGGRETAYVAGSVAGVIALSLLVVQVLLPTGRLEALVGGRDVRAHRIVALTLAVLVVAHVVALFVTSPDDIADALVLQAPTYSRLGVLAAACLALSIALALGRRRLGLAFSDFQLVHTTLGAVVVATAIAHTVMLDGAFDGAVEVIVCAAAALGVVLAAAHRLRRGRPGARRG